MSICTTNVYILIRLFHHDFLRTGSLFSELNWRVVNDDDGGDDDDEIDDNDAMKFIFVMLLLLQAWLWIDRLLVWSDNLVNLRERVANAVTVELMRLFM